MLQLSYAFYSKAVNHNERSMAFLLRGPLVVLVGSIKKKHITTPPNI
jgi:hypothetical protein